MVAAFTQRGTALQHQESRSQATLRPSWSSVGVGRLRLSSRGLGRCRSVVWLWFALLSCSVLSFALALSLSLALSLTRSLSGGVMGDQARYPRWQVSML